MVIDRLKARGFTLSWYILLVHVSGSLTFVAQWSEMCIDGITYLTKFNKYLNSLVWIFTSLVTLEWRWYSKDTIKLVKQIFFLEREYQIPNPCNISYYKEKENFNFIYVDDIVSETIILVTPMSHDSCPLVITKLFWKHWNERMLNFVYYPTKFMVHEFFHTHWYWIYKTYSFYVWSFHITILKNPKSTHQIHEQNTWFFAFWKVYTRRCSLHALGNHGNCDYIKGQTPPSKATMWEGLFFTFFKMVHALSPIVHPLPWKEIKKEKEKEVIGSFKWMSACTKWYIMEKMPTFMLSPNTINSLCFQDWSCPSCPLIYCWFNLTYNVTWYLILFECQYVWQQI